MLRKLIVAAVLALGIVGVASAGQHYSVGGGAVRVDVEQAGLNSGVDLWVGGQHYSVGGGS